MAPHRPRPIRAQPATHPATQPPNSTPTQLQRQQPPKASSDRSKQPTSRHTQPHREHTQSLHHVSAIRHKARHQMCDDRDHGPFQITTRAARERESGREREGADRRRRERERERDSRRERERGEEQDRENHAEGRPAAQVTHVARRRVRMAPQRAWLHSAPGSVWQVAGSVHPRQHGGHTRN